jgi:hypothetical protein
MTYQEIAVAVREIASRCDGAETQDGVGFNGTDSHFGKAIANLPDSAWTPGLARQAWDMLHKYKGQLAEYGVDYDALPVPDAPPTRDYAAVDLDGDRLVFRFPYNPSVSDTLKRTVPKIRWNPPTKTWSAPATLDAVKAAKDAGFVVTEAAETAAAKPQEDKPNGTVKVVDGRIRIAFDYDGRLVSAVKGLPGRSFDGPSKSWLVPLSARDAVLAFAWEYRFTVDPSVTAISDDTVAESGRPLVDLHRGGFKVTFDYDAQYVQWIREVPGAMWDAYAKAWLAPAEAAFEVALWAERTNAVIDDATAPLFAAVEDERALIEGSYAKTSDFEVKGLLKPLFPFQRAGVEFALDRLGFINQEAS